MVERASRPPLVTFFAPDPYAVGATVTLGEEAAHHIRVRRLEIGQPVNLVNGDGGRAAGTLVRVARGHAAVDVVRVETVDAPPAVHLLLPVADRERMLWLAEKATELQVASWRPVLWRRSKSVSPRGEGVTFNAKVRARMAGALEQSGAAWLPSVFPESSLERAIAAAPDGDRILLDGEGDAFGARRSGTAITIAVGPEGGLESDERELLVAASFALARIGTSTLRFETAAVAAIGVARALLDGSSTPAPDSR